MTYTVTYAPDADRTRTRLSPAERRTLDAGMALIAEDPYGSGSSATWSAGRREATLGSSIFVVYRITAPAMLVTVVNLILRP
ncbi:hypothetical protein [Streptomyces sp. SID3343]|uniref:hypothetical protein n=1 Tax=Streptomyces sp. SID3343 TaxID=2690260 RepID=UPI0013BF4A63|nr:hypothetical protein [Streptomyces sp. SID3343]MYV98265.1 hypothetical protein [Streptomyces sp. SID3343]